MTVETTTSSALVSRFRNQWALIQTQWVAVPATSLRRAWVQIGDHVRQALNLPTRDELAGLSARLDEIDARLRDLAATSEKKNGGARKKA
jgi:hypothetical protein